jgi:DNA repair photolyase
MGPIIPGLSDRQEQLAAVVGAAVDAGATSVSSVALHLRPGVREHVLTSLRMVRPDLAAELGRRYRRAYLPAADQRALALRVRQLVDAAQGRAGARLRRRARPRAARGRVRA